MTILILLAMLAIQAQTPSPATRQLDAPYVPTPPRVVDAMLRMARVSGQDVVYDLGCGDGRIPITAALNYGARGVGVDLDPKRIEDATENAKAAGVTDKVRFVAENVFDTDFRDATVVFLYMSVDVNQRLMPKLKALKPGSRIVSHVFDMGPAWPPDERGVTDGKSYYLWIIR
jgi:cyclopropane fatty-acyl-phospholipid synthase-like methyltransferase